MGLTNGSITCRCYKVESPPTEDFLQKAETDLKRHAFQPVRVERSPRSLGWVNPRNILDTDLTVGKATYEDFILLALRIDKVTVNARLLKAHFGEAVREYVKDREKKQLSRDERAALLDKVRMQLMKEQTPATTIHEMAWNLRTHHVYFTATSDSLGQEFMDLFHDTFHCALTPLFPAVRAQLHADSVGQRESFLQVQPAMLSPYARRVREVVQEEE